MHRRKHKAQKGIFTKKIYVYIFLYIYIYMSVYIYQLNFDEKLRCFEKESEEDRRSTIETPSTRDPAWILEFERFTDIQAREYFVISFYLHLLL